MTFLKIKYLAAQAVIALSGFALAGSVMAATVTPAPTVAVTGSVSGVCRSGAAGSLSFTIDPSLAGPIAATATDATVFCSNGTPFTVTAASLNQGGTCGKLREFRRRNHRNIERRRQRDELYL